MKPLILSLGLAALALLTIATGPVAALNTSTHNLVNQAAANDPSLDSFLQGELGFLHGLVEPFHFIPAITWIGEGGIREDDVLRFLNHFHDPLRPWDEAGLPAFDSSIRWMQRNDPVQGWSWQNARDAYWTSLTTADSIERQHTWAKTFRALGHIMHLVVDASVPEHTRFDPHPLEGLCRAVHLRCLGNYEYWVSDQHRAGTEAAFIYAYLSLPWAVDPAILQQPTGDPLAFVPIARLIDTDAYTGDNPGVTVGQAIGIAEVSNANFFSEDTDDGRYRFPSLAMLEPSTLPAPKTGRARAYFKTKPAANGIEVDPALAECVLYQRTTAAGVLEPISYTCADENVWRETAIHMLPRAVGYARGVLDYFFRGRIDIAPPGRFAYGLAPFVEGNAGAFTRLRFKVRNATPGEEAGPGTLKAVIRYRTSSEDLIANPFADLSEPFYVVSDPIEVDGLSTDFREFTFDFTENTIPTNAADVFLTVVYRGPLGNENDSVLAGGKDLFEPDPVDLANISDWECVGGTLYPAWDFDAFPPYSSPGQTERDVTGDGVQDLFGPWHLRQRFLKAFDLSTQLPLPSEESFDLALPEESFAQYGRVMLLQDQSLYGTAVFTREITEIPSGVVRTNRLDAGPMRGIYNDIVRTPDGQLRRRVVSSGVYRGVASHHAILFASVGTFPCFAGTWFLPPDLSRIPGTVPAE